MKHWDRIERKEHEKTTGIESVFSVALGGATSISTSTLVPAHDCTKDHESVLKESSCSNFWIPKLANKSAQSLPISYIYIVFYSFAFYEWFRVGSEYTPP